MMELNGEKNYKKNWTMNEFEFQILGNDLRKLVTKIPLRWGRVQNNFVDDKINMFEIESYAELESVISGLSEDQINYLRRRWFLWQCSKCDEYLFYKHPNVEKNPNPYDKAWDVCISSSYPFDIKGTVIPKGMRNNFINLSSMKLIKFFYDKQSTGRRYDMQNRLFIIHHSFVDEKRELLLRCEWRTKETAYKDFIENVDSLPLFKYNGCLAQLIFIVEKQDHSIEYIIPQTDEINIEK